MQLEFDSTTQMLRVLGDDASFPVMIQRWGLSWLRGDEAVLYHDGIQHHKREVGMGCCSLTQHQHEFDYDL